MKLKNTNILFFTRTMGLGGTEKVILQLCENLNLEFNKIVVCSNGGIHEDKLTELGIKHYKIGDIEKKNIRNIVSTIFKLFKIIKNEKINIVHTHHRMAAFYSNFLRIFLNFKLVHTAHNTFYDKKILTQLALYKVNIVAVGEKVKDNLCDFYKVKRDRIKIIYNGIKKDNNEIKIIPEIEKYKKK